MPSLPLTETSDLFRRDPDRMLNVGAGAVAYRRMGTGPDVLFVHGWPASGATWRRIVPYLADSVTCHVIDLPGAGSSRFDETTPLSIPAFARAVRRVVDLLELDDVAVVGHDSGGLIARLAMGGDPRLRALGLIDTEPGSDLTWRFRSFLWARHLPGIGAQLAWALGRPRLRRHPLLLGGAFVDRSLLDGEFDEFFLRPLRERPEQLAAAVRALRAFDTRQLRELPALHGRIEVPVRLVWGEHDPFFPLAQARQLATEFPQADLVPIADAALFAHEEQPAAVADALLPVLRPS